MLARQSLLILLNHGLGGLLGVVLLYFVGHLMGPEPLGRYAYAGAIISMLALLGDLGTGQAHVKRLAEGPADSGRWVGAFAALQLSLAALVAGGFAVFLAVAIQAPEPFSWGAEGPPLALLLVLLVTFLLQSLRGIPLVTFLALRKTVQQELIILIEHGVRFPATLLAAFLYVSRPEPAAGAVGLAWASGVAVAASAAVAFYLFRRSGLTIRRPAKGQIASYIRFSLPLALATAAGALATSADRVMIGAFWDEVEVGLYHGASRLLVFLLVIPTAAFTLLFPRFSELLSRGAREDAGVLLAGAVRRLWMVVLPALVLAGVFAREGMRLVLGASFEASAAILCGLLPFVLLATASAGFSALLAGAGRSDLVARASIAATATNVLLNLLLIPRSAFGLPLLGWGGVGAAVATSGSGLIGAALFWRSARNVGRWPPILPSLARQTLAGMITAALLMAWRLSPVALPFERGWALLAAAAGGLAVYGGLLHLWREIGPADRLFFRDLLDPRAMAQVAAAELRRAPHPEGRVLP